MKNTIINAEISWYASAPLQRGRSCTIQIDQNFVKATVLRIKPPNIGAGIESNEINCGETSFVELSFIEGIDLSLCSEGSCLVMDGNQCLGTLRFKHTMRRSTNVVWQETDVNRNVRSNQKGQVAKTIWFTGLSGSGKSTVANALEKKMVADGYHTILLDGDNIRHGLCENLGFTELDRVENIRRVAEVARLMNDAGIIVLAAFIAPYLSERQMAREIIGKDYVEVYISTPIELCEQRDVKGLYALAKAGEIPNFTGVSAPYESPRNAEFVLDTGVTSLEDSVEQLLAGIVLR